MNRLLSALVVVLAFVHVEAARELQAVSKPRSVCLNTPPGKLYPKKGRTIITLKGKGYRRFWCNNSKLELNGKGKVHGDGKATLVSTDGKWKGFFLFRLSDGLPQWTIKHKNGNKRRIIAKAKPDARAPPPNGQPMTWDRRKVVYSGGPQPKVHWVVRTNTTSGKIPTKCFGDIDIDVPFTATYQLMTCQ